MENKPRSYEIYSTRLLLLTVKHVGGGSSFIRTTAAGGTGKTPPGTGCKPGAVERKTGFMQQPVEEREREREEKVLRTGHVTGLEGDHLVGVRFGVLGFAVCFVLLCRRRGRHHGLWEQRCQFGTRHVLQGQPWRKHREHPLREQGRGLHAVL